MYSPPLTCRRVRLVVGKGTLIPPCFFEKAEAGASSPPAVLPDSQPRQTLKRHLAGEEEAPSIYTLASSLSTHSGSSTHSSTHQGSPSQRVRTAYDEGGACGGSGGSSSAASPLEMGGEGSSEVDSLPPLMPLSVVLAVAQVNAPVAVAMGTPISAPMAAPTAVPIALPMAIPVSTSMANQAQWAGCRKGQCIPTWPVAPTTISSGDAASGRQQGVPHEAPLSTGMLSMAKNALASLLNSDGDAALALHLVHAHAVDALSDAAVDAPFRIGDSATGEGRAAFQPVASQGQPPSPMHAQYLPSNGFPSPPWCVATLQRAFRSSPRPRPHHARGLESLLS